MSDDKKPAPKGYIQNHRDEYTSPSGQLEPEATNVGCVEIYNQLPSPPWHGKKQSSHHFAGDLVSILGLFTPLLRPCSVLSSEHAQIRSVSEG